MALPVVKDGAKMFHGHVNLLVGAVGAEPTHAVGYTTRDGIVAVFEKTVLEHRTDELEGPIRVDTSARGLKLSGSFEQLEADVMGLALGVAPNGSQVLVGKSTQAETLQAWKAVGADYDGNNLQCKLFRARASGSPSLNFGKNLFTGVPFELTALDDETDGMYEWFFGTPANQVQTLSSGVLTRIINEGYHKVGGEGDAADQLDSITAADLVDNETLRLQIQAVAEPITLKHLVGTLELTGGVDWIMAKLNDYIDLQYDLAGTKWVETGRYDAAV